jgi:hypothetical protein
LQLNLAVPAVVADVQYGLPIMARAAPASLGMEGILQSATPEGNSHDQPGEAIINLGDSGVEHRARRPGLGIESPIPTPFQRSPHPLEYTPLLRTNSAPPQLSRMRAVTSPPPRPPFPTRLQNDLPSAPSRGIANNGCKDGYLKKYKKSGDWKASFFVLHGPQLEYYQSVRYWTHRW